MAHTYQGNREEHGPATTVIDKHQPPRVAATQRSYPSGKCHLVWQHRQSLPCEQFNAQWIDEAHHMLVTAQLISGRDPARISRIAKETVQRRWVSLGIWDHKRWELNRFARDLPAGPWKHERPLDLEPDRDARGRPAPLSDLDVRLRKFAREASRPLNQFICQVEQERRRLQREAAGGQDAADINTRASEAVRKTWTERGMWEEDWGVLPGMKWKHEYPLEAWLSGRLGPSPVTGSEVKRPPATLKSPLRSALLTEFRQKLSKRPKSVTRNALGSSHSKKIFNISDTAVRQVTGPIRPRRIFRNPEQPLRKVLGPIRPGKISKETRVIAGRKLAQLRRIGATTPSRMCESTLPSQTRLKGVLKKQPVSVLRRRLKKVSFAL